VTEEEVDRRLVCRVCGQHLGCHLLDLGGERRVGGGIAIVTTAIIVVVIATGGREGEEGDESNECESKPEFTNHTSPFADADRPGVVDYWSESYDRASLHARV
jgi:hypothetical protein